MTKTVNLQSTTETQTTVTTVTTTTTTKVETTTEYGATLYMPIDKGDEETRKYYESHGIPVLTINRYGQNRLFALVEPTEGMKALAEAEGVDISEITEAFSRDIDNHRRSHERRCAKAKSHEVASINAMMAAGYDPSADAIEVAIKISKPAKSSVDQALEAEYGMYEDKDNTKKQESNFGFSGKHKARGGYDSYSDEGNPEYIHARNVLYGQLHNVISELDGEDLEIINMILNEQSCREKAAELGVPSRTLSRHKSNLMDRLREMLEDYYI